MKKTMNGYNETKPLYCGLRNFLGEKDLNHLTKKDIKEILKCF